MGKCQICGRGNVDTISGVCGECIGKNRARVRRKRNIIKLVSILVICGIGIYFLQYLASSGILQNTMNGVSNQAIQTAQQLRKQIPNITEPISLAIKSFNVSNTNFIPPVRPKPVIDVPALEQKIHLLIDIERQKNGISALSLDQKLSSIARNHSTDMVNRNYFSHYTPEGQDPTSRGSAVGYSCHKDLGGGWYSDGLAENIFQNNLYNSVEYLNGVPVSYDWNDMDALGNSTVQGWMDSSGHRHNILTSTFDREGIGVAIASDDKVYITEDFC